MRPFQEAFLARKGVRYTSFDLSRFAMESGDITDLRFANDEADFFICFHVLEHIQDETQALSEIMRVLKPGGTLVIQVPIDWTVEQTYEYNKPDPREVGHVRRYGRDFAQHLTSVGFDVKAITAADVATPYEQRLFALDSQPIFLATKAHGSRGYIGHDLSHCTSP